jgi:hypothetical protein
VTTVANKVQFDESEIAADETARVARVLAVLIRAGVLKWSATSGAPVTGRRDELTDSIEAWLRNG